MAIRKKDDQNPQDASENQSGGSPASPAGQFLNGPVTQDFCSPEKAGYRCATQTPGCEPTGFTGQCTQQPEVGGAWPCFTALPLCQAEPTGFTGQCTDQPWPNPTRYVGCTVLHCPTNDLTHQPQICRVVEAGLRGGGGGGGLRAGAAEGGGGGEAARAATAVPGCGYTETWGLCETQLLGCGFTKQWGPQCPPPTNVPGCGWTRQWGLCETQAPKCQPSVQIPCITQDAACAPTRPELCLATERAGGGGGDYQITLLTVPVWACAPTPATQCFVCPPQQSPLPWCPPVSRGIACTVVQCGTREGGGNEAAFAAAAPQQTLATVCTQGGSGCQTYPNGDCTFFGCPPGGGGGGGQTAAAVCTQFGQQCRSAVDACPTRLCGGGGAFAAAAPQQTAATVCTQFGQQCQSAVDACPTRICTPATVCTQFGCGGGGQTAATVCTQFGQQCRSAVDACPTRLCGGGGGGAFAAAAPQQTAATVCTQFGQQCRSAVDACPTRLCDTRFGCGGGGQTAATVCTQFGQQCQSAVDACPTRLCGQEAATFWWCPESRLVPCLAPREPMERIGTTGWQGCTRPPQTFDCPTVNCHVVTWPPTYCYGYLDPETMYMYW